MSTQIMKNSNEVEALLGKDSIKERLKDILGKNASTFATSVVQIVKSNTALAECEPASVVGAAMTAATLNLPINTNLGFAYIVPYNQKQSSGAYAKVAQFQIGYKGFIQLAQRTNQFHTINVTEVKEGELGHIDYLRGDIEWNWLPRNAHREKLKTIGYVSYFSLVNGFEKSLFMTIDEINSHGGKYSKSFSHQNGLWNTDFDAMAKKTCLKLLLSKYAPLAIDQNMAKAIETDQASFKDVEDLNKIDYPDNEEVQVDPDRERLLILIQEADTEDELELAKANATEDLLPMIKAKQKELNLKNKKK